MASANEYISSTSLLEDDRRVALGKDMTLYVGCGHRYVDAWCLMQPTCAKELVFSHIHIIECADYAHIDAHDPMLEMLFESFDQLPQTELRDMH